MRLWSSAWTAFFAVAIAHGAEEKLPPRHCVAELRAARIAGQREDPAAELQALLRAVESCPAEVEPTAALLSYSTRHELPAADVAALNASLLARLGGPVELPIAVLQQIATLKNLDPGIKSAVIAHVERRVQSNPEPAALRLLAALQLRQGDRTAAVTTLERLRKSDSSQDLLWALAGLYWELERWEDFSRLLGEPAVTLDESTSMLQIEAFGRAGRAAETLAALKQLAERIDAAADRQSNAAFVDVVLRAAWNLRDAEDDAAAEELFRLAAARDAENLQAREALTFLYGTDEDREQHRAALEQRLAGETDPRVLFEEGTNRLAERDSAGAYDLLSRAAPALAIEAAWYNLGIAAFRLERWAEAADALGHAAELNPARADTHFYRGHSLVQTRSFTDAIVALTRSLELHPNRPMAHFDLALAYHETGQAELAEKHRKIYESSATAPP